MYIVCFCISIIFLIGISIFTFQIALNSGVILKANYYEKKIENNREKIAVAKASDVKKLIPKNCAYGIYDLNGKMIHGNISKDKAVAMWDVAKKNKKSSGKYYYKTIKRKNEICIAEYILNASFSSDFLNKYINAEISFAVFMFILFILDIIIFSKKFAKKFKKELGILKDTTENVQMENLDFNVKYSKISEINEIIFALEKMKNELKKSLNKQWNTEIACKKQIAALAHDIKTPLTIIKGNSELLGEMDLKSEEAKFNNNILNEIENMEFYIKSLIQIAKSEKEHCSAKREIKLMDFINDVISQGESMSLSKKIEFKSYVKDVPKVILGDEVELKRAFSNIISNATEYCNINGQIILSFIFKDNVLQVIVEDSGKGFTKEELNLATEEFFRGDKSRNAKNHYGMGLYIAKNIIEKHNGRITLSNSEKLGGGKVIVKIANAQKTKNKVLVPSTLHLYLSPAFISIL